MSDTLIGTIERITFYNDDNGYTVAQLTPDGRDYTVTVVGSLPEVSPGEFLRLHGQWTSHPRYGRQFQVEHYATVLPATAAGIEKYLGSGLIKGVGPVTARRIVLHFKLDTLRVIEEEPHRLREVLGVGPRRVTLIGRAWQEQKAIQEVMLFLQSHNVNTAHAVKIFKTYGDASIDVVRSDPYRLARDIHGIGFLTADKIARELGLAHDSPQRVQAGISYTLSQMADDGHVYAPQGELVAESARILEVPPGLVTDGIAQLAADRQVHVEPLIYAAALDQAPPDPALREERAVYLLPFYHGELGVANRLKTLMNAGRSRLAFYRDADLDRTFDFLAGQGGPALTGGQKQAVRTALTCKVAVLTGGPGTGKTTCLKTLIRLLEARRCSFALASPTGRAAKRLGEATGRAAKTIHRLLELKPQEGFQFKRNEANLLDADMVIVDEASMLDLLLTNHLLKAIHPESHLLLVGDVDQLPSVGAGNVLRDIIDSGTAAVVRLDTIFRQAEGSLIIDNAHRINRGEMPRFDRNATDFYLFPAQEAEGAGDLIVDLVHDRIPRRFGLDPLTDIQVLSPLHRGAAGVGELNRRLQAALNPPAAGKAEWRRGAIAYRVGDRVMQTINNYDKETFNGDMGRIIAVDLENQALTVRMDGRDVAYELSELDELILAYAISVHKSQGSEYRAVVMPVLTQHYMMLQRNLLYTGVTRAKELVVLVGARRAIAIAVRNNQIVDRHTALDLRLKGQTPGVSENPWGLYSPTARR
ncbi:MAG: ATP-dependent RecD-like DNA helicase [Anaerolineae bacterium]|nr:ATP-dependent RecD-like DNA helicase [Anaerolineae bacterium]